MTMMGKTVESCGAMVSEWEGVNLYVRVGDGWKGTSMCMHFSVRMPFICCMPTASPLVMVTCACLLVFILPALFTPQSCCHLQLHMVCLKSPLPTPPSYPQLFERAGPKALELMRKTVEGVDDVAYQYDCSYIMESMGWAAQVSGCWRGKYACCMRWGCSEHISSPAARAQVWWSQKLEHKERSKTN
jgi:hypothetical protein